ncbi:MAG: hypothetical protein JW765_04400 [Deltaproteobacteria bacterium]|nr:hypothetical protein [Candidatus Zymogenaceae bacterium]
MKRALIILVAMLFVVVAVGAAFAAETTFNGQYRIRAFSNWNFDKRPGHLDSEKGLYTGYFDQRFRLTITHTRSDFLKAVVQFDLVEDTWGQQRNFRINNSTTGSMVRKAYIEFKLPKIGTFTVGKQPVTLGYGLAFSDSLGNLDGLKWANKWGPVGVSAMYFKWNDNVDLGGASEFYNRDANIWALDLKYTPNENHTIELFGGYVKYDAGYPMGHVWTAGIQSRADIGFVGIAYTGEIADMLTLKAEFSGIFGHEVFSDKTDAFNGGYNIYLDASYHNDMLRAGLAFVLGSGDTGSRLGDDKYNMNFIVADAFSFGNIIAGGYGGGGLNDAWVRGLGFANDIENLTAVKLYFEVTPMEKLTLNAAVIWAKWTEPVGQATPYSHPVNYYAGGFNSWYDSTTDLGWEIDLGLKYEIMDGLTYTFAGGVLFTGDSFDYVGLGATHEDWGPIWMINNVLTYDF